MREVAVAVRERPILFQDAMVRALLAGTKSQTRRAVKHAEHIEQFERNADGSFYYDYLDEFDPAFVRSRNAPCPYGQPGDRLYVREAFSGPRCMDAAPPSKWGRSSRLWYWADGNPEYGDWTKPKPGIHMPRWASRILLEVTDVRVQRLQEISEEDAIAEGTPGGHGAIPGYAYNATPLEHYRWIWEQINGAGSWDANPWVWAVSFKRVQP